MHSSTRLCLLGLLVALLSLSTLLSPVSADGSIQVFVDANCNYPLANATAISFVSAADCQHTKDSQGNPIAFLYYCNSSHFELTLWDNSSDCSTIDVATWHVQSDQLLNFCPVAVFEDPEDKLFFYSQLQCTTQWSTDGGSEEAEAVSLEPFLALRRKVVKQTQRMIDVLRPWGDAQADEQ